MASNAPNAPSSPSIGPTFPTSTSSSSSSSRIPLPALKSKIQDAVRARRTGYSHISSLITFFEDEKTGASDDAKKLQNTFKDLLGIDATVFMIPKASIVPRWELRIQIEKIITMHHVPSPGVSSLFIFVYIGHGALGGSATHQELLFTADNGKNISWPQILHTFLPEGQIDVLAILDCCHSGLKKPRLQVSQTIRVLTACGASEEARSRKSSSTFTQRFCAELCRIPGFNNTFITVDEFFDNIRTHTMKGSPNPQLIIIAGTKPILLHFKPSNLPQPAVTRGETQHILVKLTLSESEGEDVAQFQNFVLGLPEPFYVRIVDAYKTDKSVLMLLRMTWQTWARISSTVDMKPVGVVIGQSLIHPTGYSVPQMGENLPFRNRSEEKTE